MDVAHEREAEITPSAREVIRGWAALPVRGVLFDFNGTLSDDEHLIAEIYTELFAAHLGWDMPLAEYYRTLVGRSDREIIESAVAAHGGGDGALTRELRRLRGELYQQKVTRHSPITAAAAALADRLAAGGVAMGVVTGAQREEVQLVLGASPVARHLTVVVTEEDVSAGKPDPEGYLLGASGLGLDPGQILVFEDSAAGVQAAAAAGMHCVGVTGSRSGAGLSGVTGALVSRLEPALLDLS